MPITLPTPIHRISQAEFAEIAFEVMRHAKRHLVFSLPWARSHSIRYWRS